MPAPAMASVRKTPTAPERTREGTSGASVSPPRVSFRELIAEYCWPACRMRCSDRSRGARGVELRARVVRTRIEPARHRYQMARDQGGIGQGTDADRRIEALADEVDPAGREVKIERRDAGMSGRGTRRARR